jgi:hypothetical protein
LSSTSIIGDQKHTECKLYFTFLVSEKELGSLKATGGDNATSLPNGSIPEAAGKLSEITGYFHLSVINI